MSSQCASQCKFIPEAFVCSASDPSHGHVFGVGSVLVLNAVLGFCVVSLGMMCFLMGLIRLTHHFRCQSFVVSKSARSHRVKQGRPGSSCIQPRCTCMLSRCLWFLFCFMSGFRYGEAAHPGPDVSASTWQIGLFNPSGLNSKLDLMKNLEGECWIGCETHFTKLGFHMFRRGMAALKSPYQFIQHSAFCQPRSSAEIGHYSGVIALSKCPMRVLPNSFDPDLFQTARLQVFGAKMYGTWVTIGGVYGLPDSQQHLQRTYQTEVLLDAIITRVAEQTTGPRIVCGDLNHGPGELQQLKRLHDLGFRELQHLALVRWGTPVIATGRGTKNIDQIWVSPELQAALVKVELHDDLWSGHIALTGTFECASVHQLRYQWRFPKNLSWPHEWDCSLQCDWTNPTVAYASLWFQLEHHAATFNGQPVSQAKMGRGTTLASKPRRDCVAPIKVGREGDEQPKFFGPSLTYTRWFRQLRRLQTLDRLMHKRDRSSNCMMQCHEVWRAVRFAPGFEGGFMVWCCANISQPQHAPFDVCLPAPSDVATLFQEFAQKVRAFETHLKQTRHGEARERRKQNPYQIFRDCARELPEKVDTLVQQVQVPVDEIRPDDVSIVLPHAIDLLPDLPLVCKGKSLQIVQHDHDQIWLESLEDIEPGDTLVQERITSSDHDILNTFGEVWSNRWQKLTHVPPSQWDDIVQFCQQHMPKIPWAFQEWNAPTLKKLIACKKKRAAVGLDGVSRSDLLSLPPAGVDEILQLYQSVEQGGEWPQQLLQGCVSSLFKNKGDGGVDSYRPITIFPLVTRIWSTHRARESLQNIVDHLPKSVQGGIPNRQSSAIWFEISQLLEHAFVGDAKMCGLVLDIQRAFNALPRMPIWGALAHMGFPSWLLKSWAKFVCKQERHFKIRNSIGSGHLSNVGFPEGCAFSVFAMCITDWMFDCWLTVALPAIHLYTYVDDWHLLFRECHDLGQIWGRVQAFAKVMDLEIDCAKSFLWAADGADRATLRAQHLVKVVLSAKDLGAHHNFCRRKR